MYDVHASSPLIDRQRNSEKYRSNDFSFPDSPCLSSSSSITFALPLESIHLPLADLLATAESTF
jgi:hypothetical protein